MTSLVTSRCLRVLLLFVASFSSMLAHADGFSLRFFGNGTGQLDRVKVPMDAPHRPVDVGGDFTVEFWIKGLAVENAGSVTAEANGDGWITGNVIIDRDIFGAGEHGDWGMAVGNNGSIGFGVDRSGTGRTIVTGGANVLDGSWHHIAVTRTASTGAMAIYVDGVRRADGTGPGGDVSYRDGRSTSWPASDPFLVFGAEKHDAQDIFGGSYPSFSGWLDEVRISNIVRYAGESFFRPTAPFSTDANTMGLWKFDEGEGNAINDSSGASGGPSHGTRAFGGSPNAAPLWSTDTPFGGMVLVDFGSNEFLSASPEPVGHQWNNLFTDAGSVPRANPVDLVNVTGLPAGAALSVSGFGTGANANGTTAPDPAGLGALALASATRDSFFLASGNTAAVVLTGLSPSGIYRFAFFGSRDAAQTRITQFTAQGAGSPVSGSVQTSGTGIGSPPQSNANRTFVAVCDGVRPSAGGVVTITLSVGGGDFGYLGAMQMEWIGRAGNGPPVASDVAWEGSPRIAGTLSARYSFSDPDGDSESGTAIQWERSETGSGDGSAIPGALAPTYTPASADLDYFIRVIITPGAASGLSPGVPVASGWRGPMRPATARTVFSIGNSFTRWGDVPQQVENFAESRGRPHVKGGQIRDGEGLEYHWSNGLPGGNWTRGTPSRIEIPTGTWDYLVLQPMSREFLTQNQSNLTTHAEFFDDLADASGTQLFLYCYWPYLSEPMDLQDDINAVFEALRQTLSSDGLPVRVIPVGEAFRQVVLESQAESLTGVSRADLYADDFHPSNIGYYLSSLVHYAVLYAESPVGLPAEGISANPESGAAVPINPELAAELQRIAWDVARFTPGTGIAAARYSAWAAENAPAEQTAPADDPGARGVPNLIRWVFGLDSTNLFDPARLPSISSVEGGVRITYRIGADAQDAGISVRHEWSSNLVSWNEDPPRGTTFTRSGGNVAIFLPLTPDRIFFRCRVRIE